MILSGSAAHNPKVKAGVAWYGRLMGEQTPLQPQYPIDVASILKVPVLGLYGGSDKGIPVSTVEQIRSVLKQSQAPGEIIVYPGAPYAFYADYRPSFPAVAAEGCLEALTSLVQAVWGKPEEGTKLNLNRRFS